MADRILAEQRVRVEVAAGACVVQVVQHQYAQILLPLLVRVAGVHGAGQLAQPGDLAGPDQRVERVVLARDLAARQDMVGAQRHADLGHMAEVELVEGLIGPKTLGRVARLE